MTLPTPLPTFDTVDRATFESRIVANGEPVAMRGLVAGWPVVRDALESDAAVVSRIRSHDGGRQPHVVEAAASKEGRLFYEEDLGGFGFSRQPAGIGATLDRLLSLASSQQPPAVFIESIPIDDYLPGFAAEHSMPLLDARVRPRIWIGNAVKVNTHFDLSYNIACVACGRRRFTLFPPEQLENLYLAPLDFTPSGAPVSLVELTRPDHARYPKFAEALRHARSAELGPGDAIYIPYGWWHHVESLAPFNVLVNYWWDVVAETVAPHGALVHALLAIRDLPADQRAVWANLFEQLVFTDPETALAHLPAGRRGILSAPSPARNQKIRDMIAREFSSRSGPGR
jgi:hypothetical protein